VPWPSYEERYAFPYLIGTAALLGMGASYLQRGSVSGARWAVLGWGAAALYAASGASAHASRADAVQRAADSVVARVTGEPLIDSVFVATAYAAVPAWVGLGPTLYRLSVATDRPWPPTHDIRCEEIDQRLRELARVTVVVFLSQCSGRTVSDRPVVARFRRVEWSQWRIVEDSLRADIFMSAKPLDRDSSPLRE
jgi:hypothetical protein